VYKAPFSFSIKELLKGFRNTFSNTLKRLTADQILELAPHPKMPFGITLFFGGCVKMRVFNWIKNLAIACFIIVHINT
jgi:hypothetical protein